MHDDGSNYDLLEENRSTIPERSIMLRTEYGAMTWIRYRRSGLCVKVAGFEAKKIIRCPTELKRPRSEVRFVLG